MPVIGKLRALIFIKKHKMSIHDLNYHLTRLLRKQILVLRQRSLICHSVREVHKMAVVRIWF
jgi:hypothetical protein